MKLNVIFQIILISIILIILALFYYTFLSDNKKNITEGTENKEQEKANQMASDKITNELLNIEYNSYDNNGNSFYINAEKATVDLESQKENKVKLENVVSIINLKNKGIINVYSKYAIYEKLNHDTLFYSDVKIEYLDNVIVSQNFDVLFTKDISKIYNDVIYNSDNTNLYTDIIFINMKTGDIKLEMINKSKKVKLTTKYEFN